MFLKSVEIFGFKSFADRSRIEFGEGLSTIVGPNGCGKSNVVEAVRWVLGEQSTKGLRLERMDNVIFNGTDQRHPLNVAEVTLEFSNEDNILPLEFSEVSIRRRIFRSNNSEYFINNNLVTLKEVRELLADTGLGMTGYVIMEQGRIDQILEAKPQERRGILEEAAGIKKFRIRSLEGTRRREKVKENIIQVEQILQEVEKRYHTLKSQSEKAIKHKELRDTLFKCEVLLECKKYWNYKSQLEINSDKQNKEEDALQKASQIFLDLQQQSHEFQEEIKGREQTRTELQNKISIIRTEREAVAKMMKSNLAHIEDVKRQHEVSTRQLDVLKKRKEVDLKEELELDKEKKHQATELKTIALQIEKHQIQIKKNEQELTKFNNTGRKLKERERYIDSAIAEHQHELRNVVDRLAQELDKRIAQTGYSADAQRKLETNSLHLYKKLQQEIKALSIFVNKIKDVEKKDIYSSLTAKVATILELEKEMGDAFKKYRESIPTFLQEFLENDGVLSRKHIIDEKIMVLHKEKEESKKTELELQEKIELISKDNLFLKDTIHKMEIQKNSHMQKLESTERELQRLQKTITHLDGQVKDQVAHIDMLAVGLKKWESEHASYSRTKKELDKEDASVTKQISVLNKEITSRHTDADNYTHKLHTAQQKIDKIKSQVQQYKDKGTEIEARIQMLLENFRDRHGDLLQTYLSHEEYTHSAQINEAKTKEKLADIKLKIQQLGNVNLLAAEEFDEVKERYEHLKSQLDDLTTADKDLQQVVKKIEDESRVKMEAAFKEVRKHFNDIFKRMMGGGKTDLELVDSDDILQAGIEIHAQPPEKKTHYISQLSGGERTLIALSLLFALHSVRPAPFCLLDELDAPLDDSNIDRFLNLLRSFKHITQFVVVSHSKRTIAQSQNIIGVTMEERGVSKFIGVKINEE